MFGLSHYVLQQLHARQQQHNQHHSNGPIQVHIVNFVMNNFCLQLLQHDIEMDAKDVKQMAQRASLMTQMKQAPDLTIDSSKMTSEEITKACERAHKIKEGKLEPLCLWVRAGSDGQCYGADPVCQQVWMAMKVKKRQSQQLKYRVRAVNLAKPPEEFKTHGLHQVPALVDDEEQDVMNTVDEILEYIDAKHPHPSLQYFDPDADEATDDLFSKFAFYIKEVNKDPTALTNELRKVDEHLKAAGTKFLTGSQLTHLDCRIAPVVQHIRVACKALKNYNIPGRQELPHLWQYMQLIYETPEFVKTCPTDYEIIFYWASRADTADYSSAQQAEWQKLGNHRSLKLDDTTTLNAQLATDV